MADKDSKTKLEIEIKVRLEDPTAFTAQLPALGFRLVMPETLERNLLFDTPDGLLRQRKEILRIRQYGNRWLLTHKGPSENIAGARHKIRAETETGVEDGQSMATILERLGYSRIFVYEKLRAEWTDDKGHIVVDITPIGTFAELEGEPAWIDTTAAKFGILSSQYLTQSYGQLFFGWKNTTGHPAANMTFEEIGTSS